MLGKTESYFAPGSDQPQWLKDSTELCGQQKSNPHCK